MHSKSLIKRSLLVCCILCLSFLTGIGAARLKELYFPETVTTSSEGNWGLSFQEEGEPPVANATYDELAVYDAYYAENTDEKVI